MDTDAEEQYTSEYTDDDVMDAVDSVVGLVEVDVGDPFDISHFDEDQDDDDENDEDYIDMDMDAHGLTDEEYEYDSGSDPGHLNNIYFFDPRLLRRETMNRYKIPYMTKDSTEPGTHTEGDDNGRRASVYGLLKAREYGKALPQRKVSQIFLPNTTPSVLDSYPSRAYSGQFSDDGSFFFACTQDFDIHLYDTSDMHDIKKVRTVQGETGRWTTTDCTLSPDNRFEQPSTGPQIPWLASNATRLLDADSDHQEHVALYFGDDGDDMGFGIWSLRFSPSSPEIVAGASDQCIYVYDITKRQVVHRIRGHHDEVNAVCFGEERSPNILYSGSDDGTVKVWDRRSLGSSNNKPAGIFVGHTEGVTYVASKGDGRYALSNGKDQVMKLWDLRKVKEPKDVEKDPECRVGWFAEDFDYRIMSFPGPKDFRHPKDCSVMTFRGHSVLKTLIRCHFSPSHTTGQNYAYTGSADGVVRIYSLQTGHCVQKLDVGDVLPSENLPDAAAGTFGSGLAALLGSASRRSQMKCTRDVSWHPEVNVIISTSWTGSRGASGATVRHEYQHIHAEDSKEDSST
ncbi:hypothetical protein HDU85_005319 [Gaertneriomyces sp. JEL0708]|nr:hypothetical protein HDU85_005319 [Gaertneriomyces sp. JEL0708]